MENKNIIKSSNGKQKYKSDTPYHIFWECKLYVWKFFMGCWRKREILDNKTIMAIFSGDIAYYPTFKNTAKPHNFTETKEMWIGIWKLLIQAVLEFIWRVRNEKVHEQAHLSTQIIQKRLVNCLDLKIKQLAAQRLKWRPNLRRLRKEFLCPLINEQGNPSILITAFFDGASRKNPGIGAAGAWLQISNIKEKKTQLILITAAPEESITNNEAEAMGLYQIVQYIKKEINNLQNIKINITGDSNILIKDLKGEINVKRPTLRKVLDDTVFILEQINEWLATHKLRTGNKLADYLSNIGMDNRINPSIQWEQAKNHYNNDQGEGNQFIFCPEAFTRSTNTITLYNKEIVVTLWKSEWIESEQNFYPSLREGVG